VRLLPQQQDKANTEAFMFSLRQKGTLLLLSDITTPFEDRGCRYGGGQARNLRFILYSLKNQN
jgi:hypothetical protein